MNTNKITDLHIQNPKKMTYNQMMEECKKNDIYIIKPLYSLGYTYNNNREDFKNYN